MDAVSLVDVLIPTYHRPGALAVTLAGLLIQSFKDFSVIISDQSEDEPALDAPEAGSIANLLRLRGQQVTYLRHAPPRGMAEQRHFLLDQSKARYVLFLDDDVYLESFALGNLVDAIEDEGCGFTGAALTGLSYFDDLRTEQQAIEFWSGPVTPETIEPDSPAWQRHLLHNAANLYHVQRRLRIMPGHPRRYKVAWVGGCVLYDAQKLRQVGGFSFWKDLPPVHSGEDVLAQLRVMAAYGGCGLIPSGAYHLELPTTLPDRQVDAPKVLKIT